MYPKAITGIVQVDTEEQVVDVMDNHNSTKPKRTIKPKSFDAFLKLHNARKKTDHQRLGQRFCFMYVPRKWPELFYADFPTAKEMICAWLIENQFTTYLPEVNDLENRIRELRAKFGKA